MYKIFYVVKRIFDANYKNTTADFKEGFIKCFMLFETGYNKSINTKPINQFDSVCQDMEALLHEISKVRAEKQNLLRRNEKLKQEIKSLLAKQKDPLLKVA